MISIARDSYIGVGYALDLLVESLQPFIEEVAAGVGRSGQLADGVNAATEKYPEAATYFQIDPETIESSFGFKDCYLFPDRNPVELIEFYNCQTDKKYALKIQDESILPEIHKLLYYSSAGKFTANQIRSHLGERWQKLFDNLWERGIFTDKPQSSRDFAPLSTPGVFRLQHSSLLYTSKTTGILVDPHLHSTYEMWSELPDNIGRADLEGKVNAILISHYHLDHWDLSTLMMFPPETPIVVPKVPRMSILSNNMQEGLCQAGFENVIAVDWYSEPLRIGDIEIHVLPFYGEQPLLDEQPKHPDLRSWGNTYLLRTEFYSSWFLIDSGNDIMGRMAEVADYVQQKFGNVDILLSNLGEFRTVDPFNLGAGNYWLSLSTEQMKRFPAMSDNLLTLGTKGVAEIAKIIKARYFLPYAHWWNNLGACGENEELDIMQLARAMQDNECTTEIVPWKIGDGFVTDPTGALVVRSL